MLWITDLESLKESEISTIGADFIKAKKSWLFGVRVHPLLGVQKVKTEDLNLVHF